MFSHFQCTPKWGCDDEAGVDVWAYLYPPYANKFGIRGVPIQVKSSLYQATQFVEHKRRNARIHGQDDVEMLRVMVLNGHRKPNLIRVDCAYGTAQLFAGPRPDPNDEKVRNLLGFCFHPQVANDTLDWMAQLRVKEQAGKRNRAMDFVIRGTVVQIPAPQTRDRQW